MRCPAGRRAPEAESATRRIHTLRGLSGLDPQEIKVPVLVLSMHDDELYAERVVRAGARGYISKHEATSALTEAINTILRGEVFLSGKITAHLLKRLSSGASAKSAGLDLLADRELEVYQLIGRGYNSRKIADQLHLGESTVETYRARIKEKLGLKNAAELYVHASRWIGGAG